VVVVGVVGGLAQATGQKGGQGRGGVGWNGVGWGGGTQWAQNEPETPRTLLHGTFGNVLGPPKNRVFRVLD